MKKHGAVEREELSSPKSPSGIQESSSESSGSGDDSNGVDSDGMDLFRSVMDMFTMPMGDGVGGPMMGGTPGQIFDMVNRQMQNVMAMVSNMMGSMPMMGSMGRGRPRTTWDTTSNEDVEVFNAMKKNSDSKRRPKRMASEDGEATTMAEMPVSSNATMTTPVEERVDSRDEITSNFERYLHRTREALRKSWTRMNEVLVQQRNRMNATIERALEGMRRKTMPSDSKILGESNLSNDGSFAF